MTKLSLIRISAGSAAFLGLTYTLCVLYGLAVPASYQMYPAWDSWLPGFEWITWGSFFIGLGEVVTYGVYAAVAYVLLRRLFAIKVS